MEEKLGVSEHDVYDKGRKRMIYVAHHIETETFFVATNIKSLSSAIGISYSKLYRKLSNGTGTVNYQGYLLGKTSKLIKGGQRVQGAGA